MAASSATREAMKLVVRRFYDDIWNKFDVGPVNELISPSVTFRGTLEHNTTDRDGFKRYVREIEAAFPDFYQRIDEMYVDGDRCIARMHWSATHTRDFREYKATHRRFEYLGVGIFKIINGQIQDVWAVGDTHGMFKVISVGKEGH
ncbi:hypothetical protein PV05_08065 [Exophiala xenobiotica]|uniref:SnoaL-like domain-containing protein n=1 Tax=Exophiala xenobiotica TaxID=348802 RepID=A0A0D2EX94_9EURO|nr:uncharacterized protein PV05_08065 [Exophiala xenobiotica]KIW52429.1 hypothetical protein PV05_08065 [Exophiala xenobiotica]